MLGFTGFSFGSAKPSRSRAAELQAEADSIRRSQAVIEFSLDGKVLDANDRFLDVLGYSHSELRGQHHRLLVAPEDAGTPAYTAFWDQLARGEFSRGRYRRVGKGGRPVWIQASYNPVLDERGKPYKVIKVAADITEQVERDNYMRGQCEALSRVMAVIEFDLEGNVLSANPNFLSAMGYTLPEIQGRHHSMFAEPEYTGSAEYREFWARLRRGEFDQGQYRRLGKGGREVWIEASYNPILDAGGSPCRVVKFATDITARKRLDLDFENQMRAIDRALAVIEFEVDGTIRDANTNFLQATGYTLQEVQGQHHRIFVHPDEQGSLEYAGFWSRLASGQVDQGRFRRLAKGGRDLWLQASYNPIFGADGKPYKVVKYAMDITAFLHQVMGNVHARAGQIAEASSEIAAGNGSLAARTEQQAAALEETAATMEEMAATVKQNADAALQANGLVKVASSVAASGGEAVGRVVDTMRTIRAKASKVADIIGVIDGIAFQTNILALNAAVEAARAGEEGRGFAVVAGEVRALAQRSAVAAKEIKQLISETVSEVVKGDTLVEAAGRTIRDTVDSVARVSTLMSEISTATVEQSAGIQQVAAVVAQLDQATQQNAAMVEEVAEGAKALGQESDALYALVSRYIPQR
jgi:methyl-accepting chemotaxis protein